MLSRTAQILDNTLARWQQWDAGPEYRLAEPPKVIQQLLGGLTNQTFLVASGDFRAALRVNAANTDFLGIDRDREQLLLKTLQSSGSVPKLLYVDRDAQVTELIRGRHLTVNDLADKDIQYHLETCINRIQSYAIKNMNPRNYLSYIHLYSDQLTDFQGLAEIEDAATTIDNSIWVPVIGHHDLVLENVIYNDQKMYFIDWEYAHLGHPLIDHIKLFGRDYCADKADTQTINALETLQRGIEKLWYAVQDIEKKNHRESQEKKNEQAS
mgnify:FL=1